MKRLLVVLALFLSSCGHSPVAPVSSAAPAARPLAQHQDRGFIRRADVRVEGGVLAVALVSEQPMDGLGVTLFPQLYLDTDRNIATGYAIGSIGAEYVALVTEALTDGTYPIVSDFGDGGLIVVGYGTLDAMRRRFEMRIPLASLGDARSMDWMLEVLGSDCYFSASGSTR